MKKMAFTLAEVLITLGIIGIVAAMTLPGVIVSYEKQEALSRLKKTYATVANALQKAAIENGDLDSWDWSNPDKILKEYLMPNFASSAKMYGTNCAYGGCFCLAKDNGPAVYYPEKLPYTWPGGQGITSPMHIGVPSVQFMDGACVNFSNVSSMEVWMDINGPLKKPNKVGKDVFVFHIGSKGQLLPYTYLGCEDDVAFRPSATGLECGSRIVREGWEINYNWHF